MAKVSVEMMAKFDCPKCFCASMTDPGTSPGKTVVCGVCGSSHRVADVSYSVMDWNKRNREQAKSSGRHPNNA